MDNHHYVSGFFATSEEAHATRAELMERGLPDDQLHIYASDTPVTSGVPTDDSNAVLKDVVVQGAIGTAVGTGVGALAQVALVATNVSLFIASPLLAPLVMMGWGASIGAVVGTAMGATSSDGAAQKEKEGWLSNLVADAIANGQFVLVAETRTGQQTATAQDVIKASVGGYKDVSAA
jgi:sorbitol-specific phosphotransferase system component IIBC